MSMDRDEFYNSLYLAHHGVKGQKWGVRRYQNEDGSYTEEGAKRRRSENKQGISDGAKKALKVGAIAAGTALAAIGAYKLRQAVDIPYVTHFAAKNTKEFVKGAYDKAKDTKIGKFAGKTLKDAGKAAIGAAFATVGGIAANKAASNFKDKPGDDEQARNVNLLKREITTAAIRGAAGSASNRVRGNNGNNSGQMSGSTYTDIVSKVGEPYSRNPWGKQDVESRYVSLLNSYPDQKKGIKDMRHRKFDIEQIEKYYSK